MLRTKKNGLTKSLRRRSKKRDRRRLQVEALESRRLLATTVSGIVFDDVNADGAYQPQSGETTIEGATVYVDVNNDGVLSDVAITVEPDDFVDTAILNNRTPGLTLRTADRFNNRIFDVTSKSVTQTSTGTQAFAHENIAFWMLDRKLRIDLDSPGRSIGIDFIGGIASAEKGTLEIYDSEDQLLDSFTTGDITLGQIATMTLERPQGDIAYAIAYTSVGSRGRLDNLQINHLGPLTEPFAVTDADGQYTISSDLTGTFAIRKASEDGVLQTLPTTRDLPSVLIAVEDRRDHLFDSERGIQYIATGHGTIERHHVATQTMMAPLYVGGSLRGMDLSPDGNFLYVGEENLGPETGFIRKINLDTLEKTNISYPISEDESGVRDLTIADNGKALFSITFDGSGSVPLWALDLATQQVQTSLAGVEQFTLFRDPTTAVWCSSMVRIVTPTRSELTTLTQTPIPPHARSTMLSAPLPPSIAMAL
jgi:hypothetical protein